HARLVELAAELAHIDDAAADAMDALAARARSIAPRDVAIGSQGGDAERRLKKGRREAPVRLPYRAFAARGGARILVGRGGADNDALTFRTARPHDLWLHAKSRAGAHVIVPLDKGHTCPPDLLIDAAHLAAHFSDARDVASVEIQTTPRRYLE